VPVVWQKMLKIAEILVSELTAKMVENQRNEPTESTIFKGFLLGA